MAGLQGSIKGSHVVSRPEFKVRPVSKTDYSFSAIFGFMILVIIDNKI